MLKELFDAIVANGTHYDTLELNSDNIYLTNGCGVGVFIGIENNKFKIQFNVGKHDETVIKTTIPEAIEELNTTCWDALDWS